MIQMHRSGELVETLSKAGIESKIAEPPNGKEKEALTEADTIPSPSNTSTTKS